jgi:hypothetical protein
MSIDNSKKSPRLLQSRRYTHDTFTDAQEAFTSVLDINANEIYVDQDLIPVSSVPFGTSGDNLSIYSSGGQDVMKYYYRYKMTKSSTNTEVWFFTTGTTAGIDAQLIDSNQQKNFISPKYSIPSLSTANAEDSPAGYGVKVFVSTNASSPSAGDQISSTKFVFDYKTGVLQFVLTADKPSDSQYVYISAYQYVGRTLKDSLNNLGSAGIFQQTGSYYSTINDIKITGSLVTTGDLTVEGTLTAKTLIISSSVTNMIVQYASGSTAFGDTVNDNHNFTGSVNITGSLTINGQSFTAATSGTSGSSGTAGSSGTSGSSGISGTRNYTVTNSGASAYTIDGSSNPTLNLLRGFTYTFSVSASGHPFWIQTTSGAYSSGNLYSSGVTNNGAQSGTITFAIPYNAPNTLYYVCQYHSSMAGTINITDVGPAGTSGTSGSSGSNGSSGSSGTAGSSGSSGISGVNGSNGTSGTSGSSGSSGDSIFAQTGSAPYDFWATSKNVQITGSLITSGSVIIRGDLTVEGTTTLNQKNDLNRESLIVSGALNIVERRVNTTLTSASLYFNNELSIINNTISNLTFPGTYIDSGEF